MARLMRPTSARVEASIAPASSPRAARWRSTADLLRLVPSPGAALSLYIAIGCHWLSFRRDLHSNLAAMAAIFCRK
jgi:hypothetical protein